MYGLDFHVDKFLTRSLNESRDFFDSCAESYFGERFLKNFEWKKGMPLEYLVPKDRDVYEVASIWCSDDKTYLQLRKDDNNFRKQNILETRSLPNFILDLNEVLTGQGVFNIFHELTHCYLKHKSYHENFKSLQKIGYNFMEAFCEFSAYDIIRSSIKIKDSFPDSLVYAKEEMDKYSAVVNYAKYFPYLSYCPEDFFIFSEESEPFINPLDDQGRFVKNPLQSRLISLFSILNKESRFKLLESPPKSRNELLRLSRGPFDSSCCLLN